MSKVAPHTTTAWLWGGLFFGGLLVLLLSGAGLWLRFQENRTIAQYPGSAVVSQHSNYKGLPRQVRWDNTYLSADPFPEVYGWYSYRFGMGTEEVASGNCIGMSGEEAQWFGRVYTTVSLCDTRQGRLIFVTRTLARR